MLLIQDCFSLKVPRFYLVLHFLLLKTMYLIFFCKKSERVLKCLGIHIKYYNLHLWRQIVNPSPSSQECLSEYFELIQTRCIYLSIDSQLGLEPDQVQPPYRSSCLWGALIAFTLECKLCKWQRLLPIILIL